jgi:hypothetical protein
VTGRIDTITLPTGGTIAYHYSGGTNGINCADGAPATLTRIVNPGGTWTYTRSGTTPAFTTTITSPPDPLTGQANQTVINFQQNYETQRSDYQGAATGTPLATTYTCDLIPSFRTKLSMISSKERGREYVEEQAHGSAEDRGAEATGGVRKAAGLVCRSQ